MPVPNRRKDDPKGPRDELTALEIEHIIGIMRATKARWEADRLALEERARSSVDGYVQEALLATTNEIYLLTECLRKLWLLRQKHPPRPPSLAT